MDRGNADQDRPVERIAGLRPLVRMASIMSDSHEPPSVSSASAASSEARAPSGLEVSGFSLRPSGFRLSPLPMTTRDPLLTRSTLIRRVKDPQDGEAWSEFLDTYSGLIRRLALKAGLNEDEVQEVVHEVFIGVSRNIGGFTYNRAKCSFKHWLSQAVRWRIRDQIGRRRPVSAAAAAGVASGAGPAADADAVAAPSAFEAQWEAEWQRHLIRTASERVKARVQAKQFQIYHLHVLRELPVPEVARRLRVSRAQVYLARLRVGRVFRSELKKAQEREG
jgi:RNA polymerase sigma-70 factor (ECF subfamily)